MFFINELQTLRQQKQQITQKEERLLTPIFTDMDELETVYNLFKDLVTTDEPPGKREAVAQNKKFIFIALCFFSPGTLAGYRFPHRLRARLAQVLGTYPEFISHNIKNVIFQYHKIKAYKEELEYLYSAIENKLISTGKISISPSKNV